ncbi:MAG: Wzz/FepE/Etk N-terminal domain-containing protein [Gracilimonas sp.]|nr:Wzz/FepE/Etk N-terminal domain-containing protein [Gracilimonas sp.]
MSSKDSKTSQSSLMFFLKLLISNWKTLIGIYVGVGLLTVIILLLLPKWYKSEATVVILEENQSAISSMLNQFSAFGLGGFGENNVATYIEYAHTKKMYDRLIKEFDLDKVYETEFVEDTYEAIFENLDVTDNENKTFNISYLYKEDQEKAADIVQFIFKELDQIALEVDRAEASNFRQYVENYYSEITSKLKSDEDSLARFQVETGILDLGKQTEVAIESIAELEKQKISLEIEKNYVKNVFEDNNRINEIDNRISAIRSKITDLQKNSTEVLVAIDSLPKQGADFLRLKRDILIGEKVSEFLRLQYEQALLDEQKINSNLYLVDPPSVPEKKYKPQRTRILFIVMFFTVLLSLIYIRAKVFYKDHYQSLKEML